VSADSISLPSVSSRKAHIRLFWLEYLCLFTIILFSLPASAQTHGGEVSILLQDVRNESESVRQAAASALVEVSKDSITKALPLLKEALQDKSYFVRRIVAWVISNVNQERAREAALSLETVLSDPDLRVRVVAVDSLGRLGPGAIPEVVRALKRAIHDKHLIVRVYAVESLGKIGPPAAETLSDLATVAAAPERLLRASVMTSLGKIGRGPAAPDVINILKLGLKDNDVFVRFSAAEAMGHIGSQAEPGVTDLRESLQDPDALVRHTVITALAKIANAGVAGARPGLEEALQSPRTDIRLVAVDSFWRFGVPVRDTLPLIQKLLNDPHPEIRRAAAKALGGVRPAPPGLVAVLKDVLRDQDSSVREEVATALGRMRTDAQDAVSALLLSLQDSEAQVRRAAARSLGDITPATPEIVLALKARLADESEPVRQAAVWALFKMGEQPPDAMPSLIKMLQDSEPESRRGAVLLLQRTGPTAKDAVPSLTKLLRDPEEQVRSAAIAALGEIGMEAAEAVPALTEKLLDRGEKDNVRQAAAQSLGKIGPRAKDAVLALRETMRDKNQGISSSSALALTGIVSPAELVPVLIEDLKSREVSSQRAALAGLGSMGKNAKDAVSNVIEIMSTSNEEISNYAASTLGEIGLVAKQALPVLTDRLRDSRKRGSSAHAIARIATALQDAGSTDTIRQLELAYVTLASSKDVGSEERDNLRRAIDDLKRQRLVNFVDQVLDWTAANPTWTITIVAYIVVNIISYSLYLISPLTLLKVNDFFQQHTKFLRIGKWEPLKYLFFIPSRLQHGTRVLDAWVYAHISVAKAEFASKGTVKDRNVYISLPVTLDGAILPTLATESLRPTFEKGQAYLLICGEGGAGKTSLACQIAKWAMAEEGTRLCPHLMLPVLIEDEIDISVGSAKNPLNEAIRGQLRVLIQSEVPIPEKLLLELLKRKRVLVIVDHLSEMSEGTRKQISPAQPDFPVNALVVTSRIEERLDGVSKTVLKPMRVQGNQLSSFMDAYLTSIGKRSLFNDEQFFEVCRTLSVMVGKRDITILLAKLYADQRIAIREGTANDELARNIPELMLSYLNNINRSATDLDPDDRMVQKVAKIIAWECVKDKFRSTVAKRESILLALAGESKPAELMRYAENRLRLIHTRGPDKNQIRFALDPLAEYLAALHWVDSYGNNQTSWEAFFNSIDSAGEPLMQTREFIFALGECCQAYCLDNKVKDFVSTQIEKRLGHLTMPTEDCIGTRSSTTAA
jgi:HEAT repeat protein